MADPKRTRYYEIEVRLKEGDGVGAWNTMTLGEHKMIASGEAPLQASLTSIESTMIRLWSDAASLIGPAPDASAVDAPKESDLSAPPF
jgi:hypothetical protein